MPVDIYNIALGKLEGNSEAALNAFKEFGKHLGDSLATLITLFDGIVVIGGGITGASVLFMPEAMDVLRGKFDCGQSRLVHDVYFLDKKEEATEFYKSTSVTIKVPFSEKTIPYNKEQKNCNCNK